MTRGSAAAPPGRIQHVLLVATGIYLVALAVWSLWWHTYQDTPIMQYAAFLIDRKHLVPYRDFFDINLPGTYAANVAIGRMFGYTDAGARYADLATLALLLGITHAIMWQFGRRARWCASLGFGVLYLTMGEWMTLQREYLLLLPVGAAVAVVCSPRLSPSWKAAVAGLLVGMAGTIKPQAALALPFVVGYAWLEARRSHSSQRSWPLSATGLTAFAVPFAVAGVYLWRNGALAGFVDVALNYWPLYDALSGTRPHRLLAGFARYAYVFDHTFTFGVHPGLPLLGAAVVGVRRALRSDLSAEAKRVVWFLVSLAACFTVSVAAAGKFWTYHWLPFDYFATLLAALAFVDDPNDAHRDVRGERTRRPAPFALAFFLLCVSWSWSFGPFRRSFDLPFDRVQAIATYLQQHAEPGDTVMPLDWTEGAVHAMLIAQASPGIPFLYDFHFFHHVSSPYIQSLRRRLMTTIDRSPPRWIVRIDRAAFAGPDAGTPFDELTRFIDHHYEKAVSRDGYEIWRRIVVPSS